jgi:hypothetical protein
MNPSWEISTGSMQTGAWGLNPSYVGKQGLRPVLRRYAMEVVLPIVTLLSISLFTVATIVLVVTTVAKAGIHF